jgi:transglutaminase-like putative cysteine protease
MNLIDMENKMEDFSRAKPEDCLEPTEIIDSNNSVVIEFLEKNIVGETSIEHAISLYYAVRDKIRYDAYDIDLSSQGLSAGRVVKSKHGWCVSKAVLLAALCRACNIPAALGYADVKNHLSTERLRDAMGTDVFYWHGYTAIWLNDVWVKATPAFNIELCEKFRIKPLEFDGTGDSIYHPFDLDGRKHMDYLNYKGEFSDVPLERIRADFSKFYPKLSMLKQGGDFDSEVDIEVS